MTTKEFAPRVAAKLLNEGLTIQNYDYNKAVDILTKKTIGPKYCLSVLNLHEITVLSHLCLMVETK